MVKAWTDDPNDVFTEQEWKRRVEQLERYFRKYSPGLAPSQIVAGLDSFYSDYANLAIAVDDAAWSFFSGLPGKRTPTHS